MKTLPPEEQKKYMEMFLKKFNIPRKNEMPILEINFGKGSKTETKSTEEK